MSSDRTRELTDQEIDQVVGAAVTQGISFSVFTKAKTIQDPSQPSNSGYDNDPFTNSSSGIT